MGLKCCHAETHKVPIEKANLKMDFNRHERIVERRVPKVRRTAAAWFKRTASLITDESIRIAIETGDPSSISGIFEGLPTPAPIDPNLRKSYEEMAALEAEVAEEIMTEIVEASLAGGKGAWGALPAMGVALVGSFDVENPYVVPSAQKRVGWLIQEVRNGTNVGLQKAVAEVIERSYTQKLGWQRAAREIRGMVGLRPDQVSAVNKLAARLFEGGMTGERLTKRIARESAKRLKYRADMIARTEMARAVNDGRHSAWKTAKDRNLFAGREVFVEWVAGLTDRTCPICADLHGSQVPLGEEFSGSPLGEAELSVYGEIPPIHPLCRCVTILKIGGV